MVKEKLIEFESEIAELFNNKKIKSPIHLYHGNEDFMIEIFEGIDKNNDWVTRQILCSSEEISSRGLLAVIKEALSLTVAY